MLQALCFLSSHFLMHLLSCTHFLHHLVLFLFLFSLLLLRLYKLLDHCSFGYMLIILVIEKFLGLLFFIFGKTHVMLYLLCMSVFIHINSLFLLVFLSFVEQSHLSFLLHFHFQSHLLFHLSLHISSSLRHDFTSFGSCLLNFLKCSIFLLLQQTNPIS